MLVPSNIAPAPSNATYNIPVAFGQSLSARFFSFEIIIETIVDLAISSLETYTF